MTKQHRATPEQWETIEKYAGFTSYICILELRARIEALEAAQQPPQDKMDRLIAIDRDDPDNSPVERIATDTFRALCAELVDKIEGKAPFGPDEEDLTNRARAALAQPEPMAPTDEELDRFADKVWSGSPRRYARAVLARWGTPANHTSQEDYDRG
jgi:hypothetical protein